MRETIPIRATAFPSCSLRRCEIAFVVSSALVLLAALMTSQAWAALPAANPFVSREVTPGWTLTHFGQGEQRRLEKPLEAAFADGKFTLQADSGMLFFKRSDEADGVGFVHQPLDGDGSITAKLTRFDGFHQWGGAGLMLRDENKPLGLYMCAMLETVHSKDLPENEHPIAASIRMRRQVSNEGFRVVRPDQVKLPVWLKVERQGKKFSSLYSPDGQSWKLLKEAEIEMEQKVSVGMTAWNRYGNGKFGVVVFEDVRVVTTEGNK
ncbi:hypothetical protein ETAA8_16380 [Anatilimnocola aggregata]|uniref:DUF1349 domain-containing protein n=1 Tax=Anatilimnocola aggregata TaxID=2528021 RepID=A0A517Y8I1_9BACT|nr:hypothetical protein ETAA8_16380 [Anatilimnocola aggregata]